MGSVVLLVLLAIDQSENKMHNLTVAGLAPVHTQRFVHSALDGYDIDALSSQCYNLCMVRNFACCAPVVDGRGDNAIKSR
jgi:hypothetical protein